MKKFKRDKELVFRMYFTWFLLGILYFFFAMFLNAFGVQFGFIVVIVLVFGSIQYFMSDKMADETPLRYKYHSCTYLLPK